MWFGVVMIDLLKSYDADNNPLDIPLIQKKPLKN